MITYSLILLQFCYATVFFYVITIASSQFFKFIPCTPLRSTPVSLTLFPDSLHSSATRYLLSYNSPHACFCFISPSFQLSLLIGALPSFLPRFTVSLQCYSDSPKRSCHFISLYYNLRSRSSSELSQDRPQAKALATLL